MPELNYFQIILNGAVFFKKQSLDIMKCYIISSLKLCFTESTHFSFFASEEDTDEYKLYSTHWCLPLKYES